MDRELDGLFVPPSVTSIYNTPPQHQRKVDNFSSHIARGQAIDPGSFRIEDWKSVERGRSLKGFFTLILPCCHMAIHDVMLHVMDGSRWIGLPGKPYIKDGVTTYTAILDFASKAAKQEFQSKALAALDKYFAEVQQ